MDARRELLQKFIRQEILEDIKETLSACGVLVQSCEPTEEKH
jgi:hypothetical protein